MPRNRKAEPQPAAGPADAAILLPEAFEDVRQELRRDADARVAHRDLHVGVRSLEPHLDLAASIGELHGVRAQIPHDLPESLRIARNGAGILIEHGLDPYPFCLCRGPHCLDGLLDERRKRDRLHIEAQFSGCDARDVEYVLDNLGQRTRIANHDVHGPALLLASNETGVHDAQVPHNRVQRRSQLVRQRGQELVLYPAGGPGDSKQALSLLLRPLAFADVAGDLRGANDCPVCIADWRDGQRNGDRAAVLPLPDGFIMLDLLPGADPAENFVLLLLAIGRNDMADRSPDHLFRRVAEHRFCRRIP